MSFTTYDQQQKMIAAAKAEQAKKSCIAEVYNAHQEFIRCQGNDKLIIELIESFYGLEVVPTASMFEDAIAANESEIKNFARRPESVHREQIIEDILGLLKAKGKNWDEFLIRNESKRLATMPLPDLRQRLANLRENVRMASIPVAQHKADLVAARPTYALPPLPAEVDAAVIKAMSSIELKALIRKHGSPAVNARLAGKV